MTLKNRQKMQKSMPKKNGWLTECHNWCYIDFSSKVYENIFSFVSQFIHGLTKYFSVFQCLQVFTV